MIGDFGEELKSRQWMDQSVVGIWIFWLYGDLWLIFGFCGLIVGLHRFFPGHGMDFLQVKSWTDCGVLRGECGH
jgi:hypothetical protein